MQTLASQTPATTIAVNRAPASALAKFALGQASISPANDNKAGWRPTLLVRRRRRMTRRGSFA